VISFEKDIRKKEIVTGKIKFQIAQSTTKSSPILWRFLEILAKSWK